MWGSGWSGGLAFSCLFRADPWHLEMPWLWWNWRCSCSCQPRPQQGQIRAASGTCSISEGNPGSRDCTCLLSYTGQVHSNVATTGMPAGSFSSQHHFQFLASAQSSFLGHRSLVLADCTLLGRCPFRLGSLFSWHRVAFSSLF